jgi:hypothetical protein
MKWKYLAQFATEEITEFTNLAPLSISRISNNRW